MKKFDYYVLDVFTTERFQGNPLSVVFTDTDLELSTYENIAREFGYSETSFIYYSPKVKALKVRSFTPSGYEVNGAGHNLLGAVYAALFKNMRIFHEQTDKKFVLMKDNAIELSIAYPTNNLPFVGMRQKPAFIGSKVDPKLCADMLTLSQAEIIHDELAPRIVETEVAHVMVPLKNLGALNKIIVNKALLIEVANSYRFQGVYCFVILEQGRDYLAQTRFFSPALGMDEDPATGSAAGPLAGFLFHQKYIQQNNSYQLLQGVSLNHPSVINFSVRPGGIWISGSSVLVMQGVLFDKQSQEKQRLVPILCSEFDVGILTFSKECNAEIFSTKDLIAELELDNSYVAEPSGVIKLRGARKNNLVKTFKTHRAA